MRIRPYIASCQDWTTGLSLLRIFTMMRSIDAVSTLSSDDLADYDIISDSGIRSLESSIADLGFQDRPLASGEPSEPPPSQKARTTFGTPGFSAEDIQSYVERALGSSGSGTIRGNALAKPVRVYVDGLFDGFNVASVLFCFVYISFALLTYYLDMHCN